MWPGHGRFVNVSTIDPLRLWTKEYTARGGGGQKSEVIGISPEPHTEPIENLERLDMAEFVSLGYVTRSSLMTTDHQRRGMKWVEVHLPGLLADRLMSLIHIGFGELFNLRAQMSIDFGIQFNTRGACSDLSLLNQDY